MTVMKLEKDNALFDLAEPKGSIDILGLGLTLPSDVTGFMDSLFANCNFKLSSLLSTFPNIHEETLDQSLISHLAQMQGPVRIGSSWVLRVDAHFIGGGRHYRTWEVADIGLIVVFRRNGKIIRSKLVFLQSKRLYASTQKYKGQDPYYRQGMGRLLVTDEEHLELVERKTIRFFDACRYAALIPRSTQDNAMERFATDHGVKMYYLFYNPVKIPWSIGSPVESQPRIESNEVGCRIIPKGVLNQFTSDSRRDTAPSYVDVKEAARDGGMGKDAEAGWRLENFVVDRFIACKEGLIDDTTNYEVLHTLMTAKSSPISSAISITFDVNN